MIGVHEEKRNPETDSATTGRFGAYLAVAVTRSAAALWGLLDQWSETTLFLRFGVLAD
jgi:hypothetical protein